MSSPDISLDLEKALKTYIETVKNLFAAKRPSHAAHEVAKELSGTYLLIIAARPDWEQMIDNAIVKVRFEFATDVKDPDSRATAATQHSTDVGKLIELLCDQNFEIALSELNKPKTGPDARAWAGLGFSGFEADPGEEDGTTETQIVSKLPYEFIVFLES